MKPLELGIEALAGGLRSAGIEQAYGPAIIAFTLGALAPVHAPRRRAVAGA